jgi:type III pantothenate kinase
MLMAVDAGNTQTVLGLFEGDELRGTWRIATEAYRSPDELGAACAGLFALKGMDLGEVEAMIVSSVVPDITRAYRRLAEGLLEVPFRVVDQGMRTGLGSAYDDPAAVGADRIVNAVATRELYGLPAIIADSGTATTVCAVDAGGVYRGGAILPGIYVAMDALVSRTAKLPRVDLEEGAPPAIATNTSDSIRSGFVYGYAGAVDSLVRRFVEELGPPEPVVVATGGIAPIIASHCKTIGEYEPHLTLKGLEILYKMNSGDDAQKVR